MFHIFHKGGRFLGDIFADFKILGHEKQAMDIAKCHFNDSIFKIYGSNCLVTVICREGEHMVHVWLHGSVFRMESTPTWLP